MPTGESIHNNVAKFVVEGQMVLSAAGAVTSYTGDNITVAKNGTGLYDITVKNPSGLKMYKKLFTAAALEDSAIGTVKDVGVKSLTQSSTDDSFTMTVRTVDAAGADVDEATNGLTVSFMFVVQTTALSQTTA